MSSNRRLLISEAVTILTYVLGSKPSLGPIKRYVYAIETVRGGGVLKLPSVVSLLPKTWIIFEPIGGPLKGEALERSIRLHFASSLLETDPDGAKKFIAESRLRLDILFFKFSFLFVIEFIFIPLRLYTSRKYI